MFKTILKSFSSLKPSTQCYYKILNLPTNASQDDIKKSYYKLAKKHHPDPATDQNTPSVITKLGQI